MTTSGKIIINTNTCDFCGVCVSICPCTAIILKEREIFVKHEKCKQCYWCMDVCPLGAIQKDGIVKDFTQKEK